MRLIRLLTAKHTGTHFVRLMLGMHSQIDAPIGGSHSPYAYVYKQYGIDTLIGDDGHKIGDDVRYYVTSSHLGYRPLATEVNDANQDAMKIGNHGKDEDKGRGNDNNITTAFLLTTLRCPYKAVLSSARRRLRHGKPKPFTSMEAICKGLGDALVLAKGKQGYDAYPIIIDGHHNVQHATQYTQHQQHRNIYGLFEQLGLVMETACLQYIQAWKPIHSSMTNPDGIYNNYGQRPITMSLSQLKTMEQLVNEHQLEPLVDHQYKQEFIRIQP